jgi:hypothetical protein
MNGTDVAARALGLALALLVLAGCGGSTSESSEPTSSTPAVPTTTEPESTTEPELAQGVELPAACKKPTDAAVEDACAAWTLVASLDSAETSAPGNRDCRLAIGASAPRGALDWADLGSLIESGIDTKAERQKARRLTALVQEQAREFCIAVDG